MALRVWLSTAAEAEGLRSKESFIQVSQVALASHFIPGAYIFSYGG